VDHSFGNHCLLHHDLLYHLFRARRNSVPSRKPVVHCESSIAYLQQYRYLVVDAVVVVVVVVDDDDDVADCCCFPYHSYHE
jgi:hypothetical protein